LIAILYHDNEHVAAQHILFGCNVNHDLGSGWHSTGQYLLLLGIHVYLFKRNSSLWWGSCLPKY